MQCISRLSLTNENHNKSVTVLRVDLDGNMQLHLQRINILAKNSSEIIHREYVVYIALLFKFWNEVRVWTFFPLKLY